MPSDRSDEELDRVVRRAIRAELELLAGRIFWTLVAGVGIFAGSGLTMAGLNTAGGTPAAAALVGFGVVLVVLGVRTLLLKWELPPYSPDGSRL
ncbi:hypothetical protein [Halorussus lipolyticus]|uniref:hypothetical protein n=1 Tax=Halorussus lipolyticus TaxID=3034024 RepID=UPI0023E8C6AF|nr:hypothetical protein [Halorussus sp. DT80]